MKTLLLAIALAAASPVSAAENHWFNPNGCDMYVSVEAGIFHVRVGSNENIFIGDDAAKEYTCIASWPLRSLEGLLQCNGGRTFHFRMETGDELIIDGKRLIDGALLDSDVCDTL